MNTKAVGEKSEGQVIAALLKAERVILIPFGDNQRYDLVIDNNGKFIRVQCKTGRLKNGVIVVRTHSKTWKNGRRTGTRGYKGEADLFGVYCPETDKVYLIPVDEVGISQLHLRIETPRNHQVEGILWAKSFELNKSEVVA